MEASVLVEKLKDFIDQHGEHAEVRVASQPEWPFEYDIRGCVDSVELGPEEDETEPKISMCCQSKIVFKNSTGDYVCTHCQDRINLDTHKEPIEPIFYIVEGSQLGYFRKEAWDACS